MQRRVSIITINKKLRYGVSVLAVMLSLIFVLTACGQSKPIVGEVSSISVGTDLDVSMKVLDGTVSAAQAKVLVENRTGSVLESGNEMDFGIEVLQDGVWKELAFKRPIVIFADALMHKEASEVLFVWGDLYGFLPKGTYRILKDFWIWNDSEERKEQEFVLAAEFRI